MYAQETKGQDCAAREPEIHGGIGRLEDVFGRIENSISNLDGRLCCVSRCPPPAATGNKVPQLVAGYASGVGSRLGALRDRMEIVASLVADITERLEV